MLWDWLWSLLKFVPKVCSGHRSRQEGTHATGRAVTGCLGPTGPSYFWCWGRCCVLINFDAMILGMIEHLGVDLPLGVVGLAEELVWFKVIQ